MTYAVSQKTPWGQVEQTPLEDMIERHAPLVKRIAHHLSGRLPDNVQVADLIQAGMIGLMEAVRQFDPTQGASFETYAGIRVRGAMLDEVRGSDWTPRSVSRNLREISDAVRRVEARLHRRASEGEIAAEMKLPLAEYQKIVREASFAQLLSMDEQDEGDDEGNSRVFDIASTDATPQQLLQSEEVHRVVADAIERLPEREKLVMALYYTEDMNLKEIGAVLGVSESRVSQIHGQAIARIRAGLGDWSD
ncbi:MAG: RNA polymerase sigma factor FliA [Thiotrichales bacterium]